MSELHLALLFDAPMQSWGLAGKFQRRSTLSHPTRSAITGMFCAAAGAAKGSVQEQELLDLFRRLRITVFVLPRETPSGTRLPVSRLEDYHTVLGTWIADGKPNPNPVQTRREYLLDARFGVVLSGDGDGIRRLERMICDPVWGVWFGRKCCIPAEPICRGAHATFEAASQRLLAGRPPSAVTVVEEVSRFEDGTDTYQDFPLSFGLPDSSAGGRAFSFRRVRVRPPVTA